ncbi:MAG TPA: hypothetical protein VFH45_04815, partial [Acidimicrobiales bacterium]|nr:hypothetical protein [Acidimicrobiales bacterium]
MRAVAAAGPVASRAGARPPGARLAALDLGSNSFHLVVAEPTPRLATVTRARHQLPLADAVQADGEIGPSLAAQAVEVTERLRLTAEAAGAERTTCYATHAFRAA